MTLDIDYRRLGLSKALTARELVAPEEALSSVKVRRKVMNLTVVVPQNSTRLVAIQEK